MADECPPDKIEGQAHPRENYDLYGHMAAEHMLRARLNAGTLPHAIVISGPEGVGKATLAYRLARIFLGAAPNNDKDLSCDPHDHICRLIEQNAHNDLRVAIRVNAKGETVRDIGVDAIRHLEKIFARHAERADGHRVGIVDVADQLNQAAGNALLKTLEEPPAGGLLILLAHQYGKLLPTLRSRVWHVPLQALTQPDMAAHFAGVDEICLALAGGAPGKIAMLQAQGAGPLYREMVATLLARPVAAGAKIIGLSERAQKPDMAGILLDMLADYLARTARAATGIDIDEVDGGEAIVMAQLGAGTNGAKLASAYSEIGDIKDQLRLNLDPGLAVMVAMEKARQAVSGA